MAEGYLWQRRYLYWRPAAINAWIFVAELKAEKAGHLSFSHPKRIPANPPPFPDIEIFIYY
jgi:hypothetical protein